MIKTTRTFKALLVAAIVAACATAAEVSFTISDKHTYVGVPVRIQISIENAEDHDPPSFPDIPNADVRTSPPSSSNAINIVNGKIDRKFTTIYTYAIIPRSEGQLTIPAFSVVADGETYATEPQTIAVRKSENEGLLSVKLIGNRDSVYVGEPINVTLEIWIRQYTSNRIKLDYNDMWNTINHDATSWGQFANLLDSRRSNVSVRSAIQADKNGRRHNYFIYSVQNQFWPERPGKLDGGSITIVADYPLSVSRNRFSVFRGPSIDRAKPVTATVEDPDIIVKAPPTQNQPAVFRGAVGTYTINAAASPTTVSVGDPITITLDINGTGRLDRLQAPPLNDQPQLTNDFRIPDETLAGIVKQNTKTFTQSIRATRDDITEIPPISFAYFDPDIEEYVTIKTDPIPISVKQNAQLPVTQMVEGTHTSSVTNLTARTEGLLANIDDPELLLTTQTVTITPATLTVAGGLPILYLATLLFQTNRRKLKSNVALGRRRTAKRNANQTLAEAIAAQDPTTTATRAANALTTYIADRCNLPAGGLTRQDAIDQLQQRNITDELINNINHLLEECETIQYAPSTSAAKDITERTQNAINQLEKENLK